MSDREGRTVPNDDDLSLPRATVAKMIQGKVHNSSDISFPPFSLHLQRVPSLSAAGGVLHKIALDSHLCPPFFATASQRFRIVARRRRMRKGHAGSGD